MTTVLNSIKEMYNEYLNEIKSILSSKELEVIEKRNAITVPYRMTLQAIGEDMYITRERVRQIEKKAISKIARNQNNFKIKEIVSFVEQFVISQDCIVTEKNIIKYLEEQGVSSDNLGVFFVALQISPILSTIKKTVVTEKSIFVNTTLSETNIKGVIKDTQNILKTTKRVLDLEELSANLNKKYEYSNRQIAAILEVTNEIKYLEGVYGLSTWRNVNPKSIKDKAIIILKRAHRPLHFRTINKLIHENEFDHKTVTVEAVHNELIRYDDFVLVGRGLYALQSWGYTKGTVKDVIYEILKENGPMKKKEIVEEVLKRRQVKIGTISLNLQKNPEFKRVGRAIYSV